MNENKMRLSVSVVLATYNGASFVIEQLESLRNQTYEIDEVLIADDCSKDNTVALVTKYIADNELTNKWKIIENEHNKGYARNFMDIAFAAHMDVVFFCDQDDIWENDKIEVMVEQLNKNKNINLLSSDLELFYDDEDALHWDKKDVEVMNNSRQMEIITFTPKNIHCQRSGCLMCVRRTFLEEIQPYWRSEWAQDDFVWKFAVMSDCCAIYHYKAIKRRMHSNNATNVKVRTRKKRIHQIELLNEYYVSLLDYVEKVQDKVLDADLKKKVISKNLSALKYRMSAVKNHNIFAWILLALNFKDCYPWNKALFLDGYFVLFKEHRKAE